MDLSINTVFVNVFTTSIIIISLFVIIATSTLLVFIFGFMPDSVPDCIFEQCDIIHNFFTDLLNVMPSEISDLFVIFRN